MGIFKAVTSTIGGALADQWLETIEPAQMNNTTLATYGVAVRKDDKRGSNKKGTEDVISNGSIIHVPENAYMLLVDGGKIISATDEPGYYQVDNSRAPSIFFSSSEQTQIAGYGNTGNGAITRPGGIKNTLVDTWERFKFGGTTPVKQRVIFINKMEIVDIRFGTSNPVPYTDRVLVPGRIVPCKVASFGTYTIKISDPMLFYSEVCDKTAKVNLEKDDLAEQYINEFLQAYQTALASLSMDMISVNDIPIKTSQLGGYMADTLDKEWLEKRGFYIQSVGIRGITFDEKTDALLAQYAQDSILFDPNARAARMTGSIAAGLEAAGSNAGGAMMGFAGVGMGMNAVGGGLGDIMNPTQGQPVQPQPVAQQATWSCGCGTKNPEATVFCGNCGSKKPQGVVKATWKCICGQENEGLFCSSCGAKKVVKAVWKCTCGQENEGSFCSGCGSKKPDAQAKYKCNKCGFEPEDAATPPKFCPSCGDVFDITDRI